MKALASLKPLSHVKSFGKTEAPKADVIETPKASQNETKSPAKKPTTKKAPAKKTPKSEE